MLSPLLDFPSKPVTSLSPDVLALHARRLTETAARACLPWIGCGDKDAADAAAVAALRHGFDRTAIRGRVIIGEGEKDDAPHLAPGEHLGPETAAPMEVAVDPLEGTQLVAEHAPGALSVLALAPPDGFLPLGRAFYMEKLIGPPAAAEALSLDASPQRVVNAVAEALRTRPGDLRIAVQQRPRHDRLVRALRRSGAQVRHFRDGDLSFALLALQDRDATPAPPIDLLWGTGGAPEGVLAAAAQRVIGGSMRMRLAPQSAAERHRLAHDPRLDTVLGRTLTAADLVRTEAVAMALTGVTDGPLLHGVQYDLARDTHVTETLVLTPGTSPQRVSSHQKPA